MALAVTAAVALPAGDRPGSDVAPPAAAGGLVLRPRAPAPAPQPALFARYGAVELVLPSAAVQSVAYHEASFANALAMVPVGDIVVNDNPTKFSGPDTAEGPRALVLSSRGRPHPATSAVDLVLDDGEDVRSVVTGTVSLVEPYQLYGRHPDTRVEIVPAARPDLRVVLIHVEEVQVQVGDEVVAGETVLAGTANLFPFRSHVDRYVSGAPRPHVHVEIKLPDAGADTGGPRR